MVPEPPARVTSSRGTRGTSSHGQGSTGGASICGGVRPSVPNGAAGAGGSAGTAAAASVCGAPSDGAAVATAGGTGWAGRLVSGAGGAEAGWGAGTCGAAAEAGAGEACGSTGSGSGLGRANSDPAGTVTDDRPGAAPGPGKGVISDASPSPDSPTAPPQITPAPNPRTPAPRRPAPRSGAFPPSASGHLCLDAPWRLAACIARPAGRITPQPAPTHKAPADAASDR